MAAAIIAALGAIAVVAYAFGLAGAGHGWMAPLWFSLPLIVIYPAVALQAVRSGPSWPALPLAAAALVGDILLRRNILLEEAEYFQAMGTSARIWLIFWFGWQIVLAAAVADRLWHRRRPAPADS